MGKEKEKQSAGRNLCMFLVLNSKNNIHVHVMHVDLLILATNMYIVVFQCV